MDVISNLVSMGKQEDQGYKKPAVLEEVQELILNCFDYFCKSIPKKYETM